MKPHIPAMPRRTVQLDGPDPIDVHVGERLREARLRAGLTQAALGAGMGLTFQAVQKFEAGRMRLSTRRLIAAAKLLDCPVSSFFEGLGPEGELSKHAAEFTPKELELIAAFRAIKDKRLREDVRELFARLAAWYGRAEACDEEHKRVLDPV